MSKAEQARIEAAKLDAERARKRLVTTVTALQQRLKPAHLADQAWNGVKDKGGELADGAVDAVKARPAAAAGAIAALALFLARKPLASGAAKLWSQVRNGNHHNGVGTDPTIEGLEE